MEDQRKLESLGLGMTRTAGGGYTVSIHADADENMGDQWYRREWPAGVSEHRVCDEVQRMVCGWIELGQLGLSGAYSELRLTDAY